MREKAVNQSNINLLRFHILSEARLPINAIDPSYNAPELS